MELPIFDDHRSIDLLRATVAPGWRVQLLGPENSMIKFLFPSPNHQETRKLDFNSLGPETEEPSQPLDFYGVETTRHSGAGNSVSAIALSAEWPVRPSLLLKLDTIGEKLVEAWVDKARADIDK